METAAKEQYLSATNVRARYDNISDMTLFRWIKDPDLNFPKPIYLGRMRYWKTSDLVEWERYCASKARSSAAA